MTRNTGLALVGVGVLLVVLGSLVAAAIKLVVWLVGVALAVAGAVLVWKHRSHRPGS